jgi:hypothetical protein
MVRFLYPLILAGVLFGNPISIRNERMEVTLDAAFPRVLAYRVSGHPDLGGAIPSERPVIELNGAAYTPPELRIRQIAEGSRASYVIDAPALNLELEFVFHLEGDELGFDLVRVLERGQFRLRTLHFPRHFLVRMPAGRPGASMYRGEYQRRQWKELSYRGGYGQDTARFATIAEEDGERDPASVNWAAAYATGICVTIANNIAYWKLSTQLLGFDGRATDFALWNGPYYYRLGDQRQPMLTSRVAILVRDANQDGKVDWMEAALWHRQSFPKPNPIYAGPTYIYKIINAWGPPPPRNQPVTSFEECLTIIRSIAELTGGLPQIVFLVGWQYEGHDSGYPSLDRVNPDAGGREKLLWLAREAKKYNAVISYHINLDDAYREYPGWDPKVLCLGRDGQPYPWIFYKGPGVNLQAYHISHAKEVETGYFARRAQAFLDTAPVEKALHLDTFRYSNISFGPGESIGMNEELVLGCREIFKWFAARGIDVSSEGPYDGFYGTLSWFLHRQAIHDPFHLMMMHGKAYGGGKPAEPFGEVMGWSVDRAFQAHSHEFGTVYSAEQAGEVFYLGALLQDYLARKDLLWLGTDGTESVARYSGDCVARQKKGGPLLVKEGDVILADGQDRMIPLSSSEIRFYSVTGGERSWTLPPAWAGTSVELLELGAGAHPSKQLRLNGRRFDLTMESRRPYALRKNP